MSNENKRPFSIGKHDKVLRPDLFKDENLEALKYDSITIEQGRQHHYKQDVETAKDLLIDSLKNIVVLMKYNSLTKPTLASKLNKHLEEISNTLSKEILMYGESAEWLSIRIEYWETNCQHYWELERRTVRSIVVQGFYGTAPMQDAMDSMSMAIDCKKAMYEFTGKYIKQK